MTENQVNIILKFFHIDQGKEFIDMTIIIIFFNEYDIIHEITSIYSFSFE